MNAFPKSRERTRGFAALLLFLSILSFFTSGWAGNQGETVTITLKVPVQIISTSGEVTGVKESVIGTQLTLVGADAGQVTLQDGNGNRFRIAIAATDYMPATPVATFAPSRPEPAQPAVGQSKDSSAQNGFAAVVATLVQAGGHLTPEVRSAYLAWQEKTVLAKLNDTGQSVPADCLAEVRADPVLRDAMFAAIDPPDPSILQNYAQLRSTLGEDFMAKYRSLVLAAAVATRTNGARVRTDKEYAQQFEAPPTETKSPEQVATDSLVDVIADFMTSNNIAAIDLYQDQGKQQQLVAFLQGKKLDANLIASVSDPKLLIGLLKQAMIKLGQRPARRELPPDIATWLRYLRSIIEATPTSVPVAKNGSPAPWPRFPIAKAPWPILMPLYHPYPLGEAKYIWEKYQGEHGPDRYHTYGPYRKGEPEHILELQSSSWNWNAWPDVLVHGGICTIMSTMAAETHVALGEPAFMAGQPGHSNLMSYREANGYWYTVIEQSFAGGPDVTYGGWMFNEIQTAPGLGEQSHRPWASSEYQLGLAQAMNVGLDAYIDSRIAVNIFNQLSAEQKATLGTQLLTQATQINPFNAAPWQLLAAQTTDAEQGLALAQRVVAASKGEETPKSNGEKPSLDPATSSSNVVYPKQVTQAIHGYWSVLADRVISEAISSHPLPKNSAATSDIYAFLQSVRGLPSGLNVAYRVQEEGPEAVETDLEGAIHNHLETGKDNKKQERSFAAELSSFLAAIGADERESFLARMKALFPADTIIDPYLIVIDKAEAKAKMYGH